MTEPIRMVVWTNGKAIRRYTGQDRLSWGTRHTPEKGWRKMIAELRECPEVSPYDADSKIHTTTGRRMAT